MSSANVITLSDENFEAEILNSDIPCLVDFWAEWCMPCKMLTPVIDELADAMVGKVKIGKVDTDACNDVPLKYGIRSIPTIVIIKSGEVVKKFVGLQSKADLAAALEELL